MKCQNVGESGSLPSSALWVRWRSPVHEAELGDEGWLRRYQWRAFRLIVAFAVLGFLTITVRGFYLVGGMPWSDVFNLLLLVCSLIWLERRPRHLGTVSWMVLGVFLLNALDGLLPPGPVMATHTLVLLPLLVLFGTLLGNVALSLVATALVLAIDVMTLIHFWPLTKEDFTILTNLIIATLLIGLASYGVWTQQRRLLRQMGQQARAIRRQLDSRNRLNAVLFHDIRNPLTALVGYLDLAGRQSPVSSPEISAANNMAWRIHSIIEGARVFETQRHELRLESVGVAALFEDLCNMLSLPLAQKEQRLILKEGADLQVVSNPALLCNSILANLTVNAGKFSPRGAALEMTVTEENQWVRWAVRDQGPGFPPSALQSVRSGQRLPSQSGAEGEVGTGYGLTIAAHFLAALGGHLELRNHPEGGAEVAVLLPRTNGSGAAV